MTNNSANKISNFGNVIYDSGSDASNGRKRIGISATEIELLDDIPPTTGTGVTTSRDDLPDQARVFDTQKQSNNYHTLSGNRLQPKANVVYQDGNEQHLNSAVDKLLEKYAPDATPHNLLNTTTSRQPLTQANFTTARDEPSLSTFQTNPPPSSTLSHNYSSIIRPQSSQNQTQINNNNRQQSTRPASTYDSFQHTLPQSQQQQQSKASIPIKTKNGIVNQVVPGKLYTLDDDPLHLLFDRQNIPPPNSQQFSQQPSFISTFQPSNNAQINQDPLSVLYTDESQRYPPKPLPMTTDSRSNGLQTFDLGNLIERVQQDYAREIQPFVSSIKFVQKDKEYGQSLSDVGFTTPVTVRKGFTRQADDILRRSFTRQAQQANRYDHSDYSDYEDDDIDNLPSSNPHHPLQNLDSKHSFTSVTSASTRNSDYDDQNSSFINRKSKVTVQDQATSPPPKLNQSRTQPQVQKPPVTSVAVPLKSVTTNETDEETTTTTGNRPVVTKFAQRISSDQPTMSSSGSITSDDQEDYTATYNEHEPSSNSRPNPSESIKAIVNAPIAQPIDARTRERINAGNQPQQRSEDIRPTPPTIRPSTDSRAPVRKSESEESGSEVSGSDVVSESEDEPQSAAPINQMPPTPTTNSRTTVQQNTTSTSAVRSSNTPQTNTRGTTAQNPPPVRSSNTPQTNARGTTAENAPPVRSSNAPQTNARGTTAQNPPSTSRTTTDNNARQAGGTAANPNIHFVPPDQRATTNERGGPATSSNQQGSTGSAAQTGSTRFFQSDGNTKEKLSIKDAPAAFGNKIKSLFSRK